MNRPLRAVISVAIRMTLGHPDANDAIFEIAPGLLGLPLGRFVVVFRFMTPDEMAAIGRQTSGRLVARVVREDELETVVSEQTIAKASPQTVPAAAEDLLQAVRTAFRQRFR